MEKLLEILSNCCPAVDFAKEEQLIDENVIDSVDLVAIISDIEEEYGISIPYEEIIPENFNSVADIAAMVERLKK